jgi:hypothetical protein
LRRSLELNNASSRDAYAVMNRSPGPCSHAISSAPSVPATHARYADAPTIAAALPDTNMRAPTTAFCGFFGDENQPHGKIDNRPHDVEVIAVDGVLAGVVVVVEGAAVDGVD